MLSLFFLAITLPEVVSPLNYLLMNICKDKKYSFLAVVKEDQWTSFRRIFLAILSLDDKKVHMLWCNIWLYSDDWMLEVTRVLL